jgi:beta-glucosidase
VNALIQSFYPGAMGGQAIAEAIFGVFSPSGKLPVSFYRSTNDIPAFNDYNMANRTYRYFKGSPLYPFGFGLGYSDFVLSNATVTQSEVKVQVRNNGKRDARETVQVYAESPGVREIRSLCGIACIFLKSGEEQTLRIPLNKNTFSRYDDKGDMQLIKGTHTLHIGFTQNDALSVRLYGKAPLSAKITV